MVITLARPLSQTHEYKVISALEEHGCSGHRRVRDIKFTINRADKSWCTLGG